MTTAFIAAFIVLAFVLEWIAAAVFLWLGARWARIEGANWSKAALATLAIFLIRIVGLVLVLLASLQIATLPDKNNFLLFVELGSFVIDTILCWFVIAAIFNAAFKRAVFAWLVSLGSTAVALAMLLLLIRPFCFETFKTSANSMAPTLLGRHLEGVCKRCGGTTYCSVPEGSTSMSNRGELMICGHCFRTERMEPASNEVLDEDHFVVNKLLLPHRWDIIAFRFPEDMTMNRVARVVGFPNEQITIKDGAVWVNGERQSPPDGLKELTYVDDFGDDFPIISMTLWGTTSHPAKLGPGEYFVLGDFSLRAADSRLWQTGAPGHPPYALPSACILGVVTHIYWPQQRMRVLR